MRVSDKFMEADSVEGFVDNISILSTAGASVIHARTDEISRALSVLRSNLIRAGHIYREWNVMDGTRQFDITNYREPLSVQGNQALDFSMEFEAPLQALKAAPQNTDNSEDAEPFTYYVYVNPQFWLENNPPVMQALITYGEVLPTTTTRIILLTSDSPLPEDVESYMTTVRMAVPGISELMKSLNYLLDSSSIPEEELFSKKLTDPEKYQICYAGAGLSKADFELYASWAIASSVYHSEDDAIIGVDDVVKGISRGKTEIVSRSDILELIPSADIAEVGGMGLLKQWIYERRNCFTDEAAEFGISPPKGIVCVGIPGSGKSLISKAIAGVFGVPVVRLDFGRVFNAYVGRSEERVRKALEMAQAMAPCILFIDEIEKGLSGTGGGGGGDSGTSSRVLGTFLTWLNDNTAPVFVVATANNISHLPPELTRRGRFDAIFASGLPGHTERLEVIKIHLKKRGRNEKHFTATEYRDLAISCKGFVPAEIESAIKDALVVAFNEGVDLEARHVKEQMRTLVPISVSHAEQIARMMPWAKINALPVSDDSSENVESQEEGAPRKRARLDPSKKTKKLH